MDLVSFVAMAIVQPKKPVGGAFGVFLGERRPEFLKQFPGQGASSVSKLVSESWGKLSDKQKAPYQQKYEAAKAQFDKDMVAFLAAGGVKEKGISAQRSDRKKEKDGKKPKDSNAPKKPVGGAYGVYMAENREMIVKSLPKDHKITDVSKVAGVQFKGLSEAAKKPYEAKFQKKMAEYKTAMEEYRKAHGANDAKDEHEEADQDGGEENKEDTVTPAPKKKARKAGA